MPPGSPEPRIDDAERAAALSALRAAAEEGRLDPRVLDARVDLLRAAQTRTDLEAALFGVTGPAARPSMPRMPGPPPPVPSSAPAVPNPPGYRPDDPLRLSGGASSTSRRGGWVVPPYLRVHALAGAVLVDCLDATPAAAVIAVTVLPGAGRVRVVLPPGWGLDADRLGRGIGAVRVAVPSRPDPGFPLLVVRGSIGVGSFKATGPSARERRRRGWPRR